MRKTVSVLMALVLSGCGTITSVYDRGIEDPLGGWARNVRKIEVASHEDPKADYASYGYGDGWSKTGVVISIIDYPFSTIADLALLPITIPGHYINK